MSKKDAEIYRRAAKLMFAEDCEVGCCYQIKVASGIDGYGAPLQMRFKAIFHPEKNEGFGGWWWSFNESQEPRILALCFAAAMAETGDL